MKNEIFIPQIALNINEKDVSLMNPLVLAYVGDAVYSLFWRTKLVKESSYKTNMLQNLSSKKVNAIEQSRLALVLKSHLSENELDIFRRAKNANFKTKPKAASIEEYRLSSAFEAVIGYLYLTGNKERLETIINILEI